MSEGDFADQNWMSEDFLLVEQLLESIIPTLKMIDPDRSVGENHAWLTDLKYLTPKPACRFRIQNETSEKASLAKRKFRLRTEKFRLRNEIVSQRPPQVIEIIGPRNQRFRGFLRFQAFTARFISRFPVRGLFCSCAGRGNKFELPGFTASTNSVRKKD
jgi:hypothetical protein